MNHKNGLEIAVVGMACRFPGANNNKEFWENVKNGTSSVSFFTDEELREAGIDPDTIKSPDYVKAKGAVTGTEWFDLHLFEYSPREAEVMDPQAKILHECAWEALEDSGYSTDVQNGLVGVYMGCATNLYWMEGVSNQARDFMREAMLLNESQFFSTRLSHKLNLKGPSYTVQTACSSSLVAIHLACQALLSGDCDMALAGGVSVTLPEKTGYFYQEGMILSPDGHCRPFDANAKGTVNGNGAGVVVLKRLEDALADRDFVYAVVKGSAVNNDGSDKVGFTAPSVEGQADVIKSAQFMAEVEPESITYVEAHGTGTVLGDPIEIEGLKLAFHTSEKAFCGIGSVKANIGHLDNAAGVAGFMKTALALQQRMLPPSINYEKPNEEIDFEHSPFYVNTRLTEWKHAELPLRAGVSSFGIGGTNAHVVLEEAPARAGSDQGRRYQLLTLSAQTETSLQAQTERLVDYLNRNRTACLADVAYTLLVGRKHLTYRRMVVVADTEEAKRELSWRDQKKMQITVCEETKPVIFMFPGQGAQYVNMGLDLYREESLFRDEVDRCCRILKEISGLDWKEFVYPADPGADSGALDQTVNTQPAVFMFEYALAKVFMKWGIRPAGMIGHSIGEYVAACLAGVMSLAHALELIYTRAKFMQPLPHGSMVSIAASTDEILPFMSDDLSLAAVNGPASCVVSGSDEGINRLQTELNRAGFQHKKLTTSHAFHSSMMDPILAEFHQKVKTIDLHQPKVPYISNLTGKWISAHEATSPEYWVRHLRHTVRFSDGIEQLMDGTDHIFVEVGPGRTLSTLVRQHVQEESATVIVNTVRHQQERVSDDQYLLRSIGTLHIHGVPIDWPEYFAHEKRNRLPLPTYPFDRRFFSIRKDESGENCSLAQDDQAAASMDGFGAAEDAARFVDTDDAERFVPANDKEQKIMKAYRDVTGVKAVGLHDDFFELGGSSLTAVNVVARLQKEFHVSVQQLFESPRVSDLARQIRYKDEKQKVDKNALKRYLLTLRERYHLGDPEERQFEEAHRLYDAKNRSYEQVNLADRLDYREILLTGSTGYLGVYLLYELLTYSNSNVHLLIRSRDRPEAENRIKEKVRFYFGPTVYDEYQHRIFVYNGDLTESRLGMEISMYEELSKKIQCIIHAAADVRHYGKYDTLLKANVLATKNVIDFSLTGVKKDVNHISTLAVASGTVKDKKDILYTEYDHDIGQVTVNPYSKTKLEAEKIVVQARAKGLHANIFRVGNIVFDSRSGKFQENIEQNALYSLLKSYINIGLVPEMEKDTDFSCIDDVSRAITLLFDKSHLMNETHHVSNPNDVSLSKLLTTPGLNVDVQETSMETFVDYIFDEKQAQRHAPDIYNIQLHSIGEEWTDLRERVEQTVFHVTAAKTNMLLGRIGFVWNEIDGQLVRKMIEYGKQVRFF